MIDEDLVEWRANPVTVRLLNNLRRLAEMEKSRICEAFWAGSEIAPEAKAQSKEAVGILDDLETATIEDIEAVERGIDEYERDKAGEL